MFSIYLCYHIHVFHQLITRAPCVGGCIMSNPIYAVFVPYNIVI